jgi:NADH-quinone oxidoreductase subunit E
MTIATKDFASKTGELCKNYPADESSLIEILHDISIEFNFLPEDSLKYVSNCLGVPLAKVYAVATFYKGFSLEPRGKYIIKVCTGTACHVRGASRNIDEIDRCIGLEPGQTSDDLKYTLEIVNCVGACAMAPVIIVNNKYYRNATSETVHEFLGDEDSACKTKAKDMDSEDSQGGDQ